MLGLRGARARSQGPLCTVLGARLARPGCADSSVRAVPEEAQRPKNLAQPLLAGFISLCASQRVAAQVSAGGASISHPLAAGLNDRRARAEPLKPGSSPTLFQDAVAPGDHAARASSRRHPLLDARATAPSGGLFSEVKAHSLLPLQGCPRRGLSSKLEAHALTSRRHTLPRGLLPPWWRPPRSSTSGTGSRPTSIY